MEEIDYLIIGGGIAGTTAAETIRSQDSASSIVILTEESNRLYSRVLLPHYLRNENTLESLFLRTEGSYQEKNIQLIAGERAIKIDTATKQVTTDKSSIFKYQKLLLATGGKVNRLVVPGSDLNEVVYLRTFEDAKKIRELISKSRQAAVLGGGFIGIDLVQSFVKNGLATTAIIREKAFWESVVGENSGKLLSQILENHGVKILTETVAEEFVGQERLEGIRLTGGTTVKADIAGVGIGIHLDIDYLKDSGLTVKKGVVTNEYLETTVPGVWAAGDLAEFYDPIVKKYHSLGNWTNSSSQGRIAALNMIGGKNIFTTAGMYSINIFDINFSFLGDPLGDENTESIERGSFAENKLARLLLKADTITGASLINLPADRNTLNSLIKSQTKITVSKEKLKDLSFDLHSLLA